MARQPKRSAFVLTSKFLSYIRVYFHIFLFISWTIIIVNCENDVSSSIRIDNNYNNDNISITTAIINNNNNNNNINSNNSFSVNNNNGGAIVGIGGQQPKFGDRLSPRHRQFNGPNNNSNQTTTIIYGGNNNSVVNSSTKILDSFYNLSNFNNNYNAQISAHNPFYTSNSNSFSSNIVQSSSSLGIDHLNYYHHDKDDQYQRLNNDQLINSNSDSVNHSNNNNNYNYVDNDTTRNSSSSNNRFNKSNTSTSGISNINNNNNNNSRRQTSDNNNLWWISGDRMNDRKNSLRNNQDKIENEEDNIEIDAVVHNIALPVAEEQQRLRRRNDYDIDRNDLIDHQNHNQHHLTNMNVSKADRLIEMSTEFFIIPSSTISNPPQDSVYQQNQQQQHHQQQQHQQITPRPVLILAPRTPSSISNLSVTPPSIISTVHLEGLRKEPWVVPVLVLSSLSMIMMGAFEIFVLFKAWRTSPSRRHLFLGQMLLLGLFSCAGLGAVLTANPSVLSCATIRFGVGVAYALVFAALLVKCVFLISLNGGVYLPAPYQGLLLLFAVLIQVAIGTQWLMTQPPDIQTLTVPISSSHLNGGSVISGNSGSSSGKFSMLITSSDITRIHGTTVISLCKTQFSEFLLSLVYIVFLIIFVTVLAIKSRGIRDNYREATYIGLAIGGAIPIWLGWTLCGLAVTDRHKDACLAFGLVATSATVFLVMFMPKGRQLAAMGKEGLYVEDREEQFSSLSRAGSGYSPSFFHFKPIKYGVMGHMPNSTANTGLGGNGGTINSPVNAVNGNNTKHQNGATLGGDRVALVAAGPPSYTRMYHYFPAHLTHPFCFYPPPPPPPPPLSTPLSPLKAIGSHTPTSAHIAQTIRYPGLFMRPDEANVYTTLEPTLSSNPNVYFQRSGGVHPGMMY